MKKEVLFLVCNGEHCKNWEECGNHVEDYGEELCDTCDYKRMILEELAKLEHEQWISWSKAVFFKLDDFSIDEITSRWKQNWIPYSDLSEEEKEKDRVYARKVMELLKI